MWIKEMERRGLLTHNNTNNIADNKPDDNINNIADTIRFKGAVIPKMRSFHDSIQPGNVKCRNSRSQQTNAASQRQNL